MCFLFTLNQWYGHCIISEAYTVSVPDDILSGGMLPCISRYLFANYVPFPNRNIISNEPCQHSRSMDPQRHWSYLFQKCRTFRIGISPCIQTPTNHPNSTFIYKVCCSYVECHPNCRTLIIRLCLYVAYHPHRTATCSMSCVLHMLHTIQIIYIYSRCFFFILCTIQTAPI